MNKSRRQRFGTLLLAGWIALLPVAQSVEAAVISTGNAIEMTERNRSIDRINEMLSREAVRDMLAELGVDADDASARVQSLTAAELDLLEQKLDELPAGGTGIVEVVGIVAIVLIVLELLDVTNFFTEF
jgi:hypothetical protein